MLLKHYLTDQGIRVCDFARAMGVSNSTATRCIFSSRGKRIGPDLALKIEAATAGVVSRDEAMYADDYLVVREDGTETSLEKPRIHKEMSDGVVLDRSIYQHTLVVKEFYNWAYGVSESQSAATHCRLWSELHPELAKIDDMSIDESFSYMKSEYRKYLKETHGE